MFCQNLIKPDMCWLLFIFLDREFHPKCYNGKFSNANNDFSVINIRNYKFNYDISYFTDFNLVFHDNLTIKFIQR